MLRKGKHPRFITWAMIAGIWAGVALGGSYFFSQQPGIGGAFGQGECLEVFDLTPVCESDLIDFDSISLYADDHFNTSTPTSGSIWK